jgi:hypothetical protein
MLHPLQYGSEQLQNKYRVNECRKAELPNQIPVKPPEMNKLTNPIANNIPGVKRIFPLHKVVNQLNTLIAGWNGD